MKRWPVKILKKLLIGFTMKIKERCRHHIIHFSFSIIWCATCGKKWLHDRGMVYKDLSFRAGGIDNQETAKGGKGVMPSNTGKQGDSPRKSLKPIGKVGLELLRGERR